MTHPLASYLKREGLSFSDFARALGGKTVSSHVSQWVSGKHLPRVHTAKQIEKATRGAVTAAQMMGLR